MTAHDSFRYKFPHNCKNCGKSFLSKNKTSKFCCLNCCWEHFKKIGLYRRINKVLTEAIACKGCGKEFYPKRRISKYCSIQCFKENHKYDPNNYAHLSEFRREVLKKHQIHKHINRENWGQFNIGKKRNEETKNKLREIAKKGWDAGQFDNDVNGRRKNLKRGEEHFNYKNGSGAIRAKLYHLFEYKEWRTAVFKRDNYTCQRCGHKRGGNLEAHHEVPFREIQKKHGFTNHLEAVKCKELFDISNGVTLCENCHAEVDEHRKRTLKKSA